MQSNLKVEKRSFYYKADQFALQERTNCSLGGDFRDSRHAEICQFDDFF